MDIRKFLCLVFQLMHNASGLLRLTETSKIEAFVSKKVTPFYSRHFPIVASHRLVLAKHTKRVLSEKELLTSKKSKGKIEFFVTDDAKGFSKMAKLFLKKNTPNPRVVNV